MWWLKNWTHLGSGFWWLCSEILRKTGVTNSKGNPVMMQLEVSDRDWAWKRWRLAPSARYKYFSTCSSLKTPTAAFRTAGDQRKQTKTRQTLTPQQKEPDFPPKSRFSQLARRWHRSWIRLCCSPSSWTSSSAGHFLNTGKNVPLIQKRRRKKWRTLQLLRLLFTQLFSSFI